MNRCASLVNPSHKSVSDLIDFLKHEWMAFESGRQYWVLTKELPHHLWHIQTEVHPNDHANIPEIHINYY